MLMMTPLIHTHNDDVKTFEHNDTINNANDTDDCDKDNCIDCNKER